jgi:hypothetical protein
MTAESATLGFREECLLLHLKCIGGEDDAYSFRNARNRADDAQRLQRFVHWEVSFEETFHRSFVLLALNVHGFAIDQNYIDFLQVGESHL